MGLLKDSIEGNEPEEDENDPKALEEKYQRLFMKIGRDFVHVEDFVDVIEQILEIIDPDDNHRVIARQNSFVNSLAAEYRDLIKSGNSEERQHLDLIDLSED